MSILIVIFFVHNYLIRLGRVLGIADMSDIFKAFFTCSLINEGTSVCFFVVGPLQGGKDKPPEPLSKKNIFFHQRTKWTKKYLSTKGTFIGGKVCPGLSGSTNNVFFVYLL